MTRLSKRERAAVVELFDERFPATFWSKVIPEPNSGCWFWIGANNGHGYGAFTINKRQWPAHRFVMSVLYGERPPTIHVDHLCRIQCCVNPRHLEYVSVRENARRGIKGVLTTHCPHGHEYTEANTQIRDGRRYCRTCLTARSSRRWLVEKAERKARRDARTAAKAALRIELGDWP